MRRLRTELHARQLEHQLAVAQLCASLHAQPRLALIFDHDIDAVDLDLRRQLALGFSLSTLGRGRAAGLAARAQPREQRLRGWIVQRQLALELRDAHRLHRLLAAQPEPQRTVVDHDFAHAERRTALGIAQRELADRDLREPEAHLRHTHRQAQPRLHPLLDSPAHQLGKRQGCERGAARGQRPSYQRPKDYAAVEPQNALGRCG